MSFLIFLILLLVQFGGKMLLRSSSSPILNSWMPTFGKDASPEPDLSFHPTLSRACSVSFTAASPSGTPSPASSDSPLNKITRARSEADLRDLPLPPVLPKRRPSAPPPFPVEESNEEEEKSPRSSASSKLNRLLSSSGLDELVSESDGMCAVEAEAKVLVAGGSFGSGGGTICGGAGGRNGRWGDGDGGFEFSNNGHESMDMYYRKMIEADPSNPLLLTNYAKFLKDARGDLVKAEEYFARSILANPNDGDALSLYGNLIWESHKDAKRAESYFDQAVKAAPDNCYVMASYAHFLWDAEEEEEGNEGNEQDKVASMAQEADPHHRFPPLAAAS